MTDAILPLLLPVETYDPLLTVPHDMQMRIFACFPQKALDLLWKILPERSRDWPYSARNVLAELLKVEPKLAKDPRFAELRRRQAQALT
jgi:hypothetical protein